MTNVAIVGASGYTARELARILAWHPHAKLALATSRQEAGTRLDAIHPELGPAPLLVEPYGPDLVAERAEVALLCLPHVASMEAVPGLRQRGVKVVDLSADYRLKDPQVYANWYGHKHTDPEGLAEAVYGLPELFRDQVPKAGLVANPGCYTSASILGLAPLVSEGLIERSGVIVDAKSGVTGAGRSPKLGTHYPECNESLSAYNVGKHRHQPEIDQVLSVVGAGGPPVEVIFTPHLVPMNRGILATIYARPLGAASEGDLFALYRSFYAESPFVRVVDHLPATKDSAYTNYCDLTVRVVRGQVLVISCLDNLLKGAAGVAVQNLNLLMGWPEGTGLLPH